MLFSTGRTSLIGTNNVPRLYLLIGVGLRMIWKKIVLVQGRA